MVGHYTNNDFYRWLSGNTMIDIEEQILRDKALWFAKGSLPEILRISIPEEAFKKRKDKQYIVAIVEVDKKDKDFIEE